MRAEELVFIGMAPPPPLAAEADPRLHEREVKERRKLIQKQHQKELDDDLVRQQQLVYETEGPDMREEMMDQLRDWYIKHREREGTFPDFPPEEEEEPSAEELAAQAAAAGGKDDKGKKDAKKDAKGKGGGDDAPPPPPAHFVNALQDSFQEWQDKWQHRDDTSNFAQKHDVNLVKQAVRPDVELKVRDEVNGLIEKELKNLQEAFEREQKAKKAKGGKGGKKGKKGKKGKGGKKGKKGKKEKRPKDPTGDKPIEILYRQLVYEGIVHKVEKCHLSDYVGSFDFLGTSMEKLADEQPDRTPDPSVAQLRAAVTEFCVLPLGSAVVKEHAPLNMTMDPKTGDPKGKPKPCTPVLISGAQGTGKKMLVNAIATETGANVFNLTPSNTDGKYTGKKVYEMVHTTFKVAQQLAPSIVWIDEMETVFKKAKGKEGPDRIQKQLVAVLNPKKGLGLINPWDRVLVIGTSSNPMDEGMKKKDQDTFKDFFCKILYTPLPNYPTRTMLWVSELEKLGVFRPSPDDIQTLSWISDRYSSGAICNVVRRTLTARRVERLPRKPFSVNELLSNLAKEAKTDVEVVQKLQRWYQETIPSVAEKLAEMDEKSGGGPGAKKEGGKKKK